MDNIVITLYKITRNIKRLEAKRDYYLKPLKSETDSVNRLRACIEQSNRMSSMCHPRFQQGVRLKNIERENTIRFLEESISATRNKLDEIERKLIELDKQKTKVRDAINRTLS